MKLGDDFGGAGQVNAGGVILKGKAVAAGIGLANHDAAQMHGQVAAGGGGIQRAHLTGVGQNPARGGVRWLGAGRTAGHPAQQRQNNQGTEVEHFAFTRRLR